ncbi:hypothetical protein AB0N56_36705 [Streptomyces microflavus]|uniref:hypothetical protein n=1 Tax=Streptomyces microflavus TaxID=1919 RepID=UPI003419524A
MQSGNNLPNDSRAKYFGQCAVMMLNALRQESDADPFSEVTSIDLSAETVPGHEGIYDQALSNALAAIVAAEWPGEEVNRRGRVHFARDLLKVIAEKIRSDPATGLCVVPRSRCRRPLPMGQGQPPAQGLLGHSDRRRPPD